MTSLSESRAWKFFFFKKKLHWLDLSEYKFRLF